MELLLSLILLAFGITQDANNAKQITEEWLATGCTFGEDLGRVVRLEPHTDARGTLYYHVDLERGYAIVSPDDQLQPIIAFSTGEYNIDCPIFDLLCKDMSHRLADMSRVDESKWDVMASVDEIIVAPLTKSKWGQQLSAPNDACYNFYTPQVYWKNYPTEIRVVSLPGDNWNFPAGCVATALAQVMYYHHFPPSATARMFNVGFILGRKHFDGQLQSIGGPYRWDLMTDTPGYGAPKDTRRAVGMLCYNAGLAVGMHYGEDGSAAMTASTAGALTGTFGYRSAVSGPFDRTKVNPNLTDGYPVLITVRSNTGAHSVIIDGLATRGVTQYHHINMGWRGSGNTWYALPRVQSFSLIDECVYNIVPAGNYNHPTPPPPVPPTPEPIPDSHVHRWSMSNVSVNTTSNGLRFSVPCTECKMEINTTGEWE